MHKRLIPLVLLVSMLACGSPSQPKPGDETEDSTGSSDTVDSGPSFGQDVTATTDGTGDTGAGGKGVWLAFAVDDSANQTFGNGDIQWTGSFSWTQKTNSIVPATSWLPTDGPYPVLYDDGPIAKGGHEQDDGVAGDHILSTKVWFAPTADTTLEYGALNEFSHWMWNGPNGQILVPKTATGTIQVPGMKLKKFGAADVKITLDLKALNEKFKIWADGGYKFFLKGTLNQWTPVQLLDDGQKGDAAANDGVLTYVQSEHLSKHVGLIAAGDEVQFIFVATQGDDEPENGQEYKAATEAYKDGVTAWTAGEKGGAWQPAPVVLSQDSKGKFLNTAIVVPAGQIAVCTPACASDESCIEGKCVKNPPVGCTPACSGDETCTEGKCVKNPPVGCTPACSGDESCTDGKCVKNPAGLTVGMVEPSKGWSTGGDVVKVIGSGFVSGADVTFGGAAGTEVTVAADGKSLTAKTPAHDAGLVDVVVKNADGKTATLPGGFYFQVLPKPTALLLGAATVNGNDKDPLSFSVIAKVVGVTQDAGASPGLQVAIGYGPEATDPVKDAAKWQWVDAAFVSEVTVKAEETWSAALPVLPVGKYAIAARVKWQGQTELGDTDGSENGIQANKLVLLTISPKSTAATLTGVTPTFAAAKGSQVVLAGENLSAAMTVQFISSFNGKKYDAKNVALVAGGLKVDTPAMPPLPVDVVVTPPGGTPLTLVKALDIQPIDVPSLDGTVGPDWNAYSLAVLGSMPTTWGEDKNELKMLYAAYDKTNLYFGILGRVEGGNAIVAYLDVDYGAATGVQNPIDLKDNAGAVDDAVAGVLKTADTKIGLDFAFATVGMAAFDGVDVANSTGAGWRNLSNVADFAWLNAPVKVAAGKDQLEASIPLATLYPNGVPATGVKLKYVIVLVNGDGSAVSNQFLPAQDGAADGTTLTTWGNLTVYPVP